MGRSDRVRHVGSDHNRCIHRSESHEQGTEKQQGKQEEGGLDPERKEGSEEIQKGSQSHPWQCHNELISRSKQREPTGSPLMPEG